MMELYPSHRRAFAFNNEEQNSSAQGASEEQEDKAASQQDSQQTEHSELEKAIASAGGDATKLVELLKAKDTELADSKVRISKLNKESADRRMELKKYKDADTAREREAMTEAERAKAEASDWQQKYEAIATEHNTMKSRLAFVESGATDPDSVLLHWNAMLLGTSPDGRKQERRKTRSQ